MTWRDIGSAPKDGTFILLCTKGAKAVWHGYYRQGREPGTRPDREWAKPGWTRTNFCDVGYEPTHWQPLPLPPA